MRNRNRGYKCLREWLFQASEVLRMVLHSAKEEQREVPLLGRCQPHVFAKVFLSHFLELRLHS